jgi:FAD-dependent urate hydroxylase
MSVAALSIRQSRPAPQSLPMTILDAVILGTGPYGLSAAAHLRTIPGLEFRAFGDPMSFWQASMPKGMLLRSSWEASHIADPKGALTLDAYRMLNGNHLSAPVSLERFVEYGLWFQRHAVPRLEKRRIASIENDSAVFRVMLEDGEEVLTRHVVVAGGIGPFAYRPGEFNGLPPSLVSHTSEHRDLHAFRSKHVVVIGGGQSALETAALLHEAGAQVEVITRAAQVHWLGWKTRLQQLGPVAKVFYSWTDVGPAGISRIVSVPRLLQQLPRRTQDKLRMRSIRPAGALWLPARLQRVRMTFGTSVASAREAGDRVHLQLTNATDRIVDHVFLGTGYRINVSRYTFLSKRILQHLCLTDGFPQLHGGFESSISGLHFLGAPASHSFGPLMYFVSGTRFASRTLRSHMEKSRANRRF